jgi:hypothetical protein
MQKRLHLRTNTYLPMPRCKTASCPPSTPPLQSCSSQPSFPLLLLHPQASNEPPLLTSIPLCVFRTVTHAVGVGGRGGREKKSGEERDESFLIMEGDTIAGGSYDREAGSESQRWKEGSKGVWRVEMEGRMSGELGTANGAARRRQFLPPDRGAHHHSSRIE